MSLREIILDIHDKWPRYRDGKTIDKNDPAHILVEKHFPAELQKLAPSYFPFLHKGSCGAGNISVAPWVASFHPRITKSAQDGYYPVFLFSTDLKRVYLSFALAATQFDNQFGENRKSIEKIREGASLIRSLCQEKDVPERLNQKSIDLSVTNAHRRYLTYEAGTVFSFPAYLTSDLPDNSVLISDYQSILKFYINLCENPVMPEIEEIVESSINPLRNPVIPEITIFSPRPLSKTKTSQTSVKSSATTRYSKESIKVGNAGEMAAIEAERKKLIDAGRRDLADKVDHLAAKNETPGWDITSFDLDGKKIYIEVKASKGAEINSIILTRNEWRAAHDNRYRKQYRIYLVKDALKESPQIEVIKDPASYLENQILCAEPSAWEVSLRSSLDHD